MVPFTLNSAIAFVEDIGKSCLHGRLPEDTVFKLFSAAAVLSSHVKSTFEPEQALRLAIESYLTAPDPITKATAVSRRVTLHAFSVIFVARMVSDYSQVGELHRRIEAKMERLRHLEKHLA